MSPDDLTDGAVVQQTDQVDIDVRTSTIIDRQLELSRVCVCMCLCVFMCVSCVFMCVSCMFMCVFFVFQTQLSRLCEQDQAVRLQEEKLQQLLREKVPADSLRLSGVQEHRFTCPCVCVHVQHTLEAALLSASQELSEQSGDAAANQSLIQQRDVLQSGLLSTCRELSRVSTVSTHICFWTFRGQLSCRGVITITNLHGLMKISMTHQNICLS